jgi:hypothetical protein
MIHHIVPPFILIKVSEQYVYGYQAEKKKRNNIALSEEEI